MKGKMLEDVRGTELGTDLKKGDIVKVVEATNLPDDSEFKYFVSPINGSWGDNSLAVYSNDVQIIA